ncbi:MAG TPA: acetylglutamate kinase [Chloroflexia bacterium]|nr:acetylglutamate kinase [Chloroflexia bacterium]
MTVVNIPALLGARAVAPVVVKLGGEIMRQTAALAALAADIAALVAAGQRVVVVHGGGPQADDLAARLGHQVRKVAGRRVTDDGALEVAKMVYGGSINVELVAALGRHGARGVGLSGVDAWLITVTRRPPTRVADPAAGEAWVDFGHVGDVAAVDDTVLDVLLDGGYVPVVASLAADTDGRIYNVNADTIATVLAVHLGAGTLYLMTNVPGILAAPPDPASRIAVCTPASIAALAAAGTLSGGMLPKVQNCLDALAGGVPRVHILDGTAEHSLRAAFAPSGTGTVVMPDPPAAAPPGSPPAEPPSPTTDTRSQL